MKALTSILVTILFITSNTNATQYCPDPLNVQTSRADSPASPASTSSAGIVTCGPSSSGCGILVASGAGICTTATAPTATYVVTVLTANAATASPTPSGIGSFTSAQGLITSCWNPMASPAAQLALSSPLSATNVILACYTTKAGVGYAWYQTVGASTTASSILSMSYSGSYCFTTNCNQGLWVYTSGCGFNARSQVDILIGVISTFILLIL